MIAQHYSLGQVLHEVSFRSLYGLVKYLPSPVFDPVRAGVVCLFARKFRTMRVKDSATFVFPRGIMVGRNVTINEYVLLDGYGGLEIGDDCRIGHSCSFVSEEHSFDRTDEAIYRQAKRKKPISVGDDVYFGAGVRVLGGVTIGTGCVVGANSVVVDDLPPMSIAVGSPARVIRTR